MLSQILAVAIFVVMFIEIVREKIPRHVVTLVAGGLTLVVVFLLTMHSWPDVWQALSFQSMAETTFWYTGAHGSTGMNTGINWSTILFITVVYSFIALTGGFSFWNMPIDKGGIANIHTLFNVVCTIIFIPFSNGLARLAELTIRKSRDEIAKESDTIELDERFLLSPSLAVSKCSEVLEKMIDYASQNYLEAITLFGRYDQKAVERITERENAIDRMEDRVNNYLIRISENEITDEESKEVTMLLRLVTEFERIGDYAINLMERAEVLYDKQAKFSDHAMEELTIIGAAVEEILQLARESFHNRSEATACMVEPLEETIDMMEDALKLQHIHRLKNGLCTIDAGLVFLETLTNLERISDHCSNVAVCLIGYKKDKETLNRHEYIQRVHQGDTQSYHDLMEAYVEKYLHKLPADE